MSEQITTTQAVTSGGKREMKKDKKTATYILLTLGVLLLCAFLGLVFIVYGYSTIYPNITAGGIKLTNMDYAKAYSAISKKWGEEPGVESGIELRVAGDTYHVDISDVSIRYDLDRTVNEALLLGRQGNFFDRAGTVLSLIFGGRDIPLYIASDDVLLSSGVQNLLKDIARDVSQPKYTFDGEKLMFFKGQSGIYVDEQKLMAFLRDKIERGDFSPAEFEAEVSEPDMVDLLMIKDEVDQPMQNPTLDLENDASGNTLILGQPGLELDLDGARKALESDEAVVELPLIITQPKYSNEEYKALLFRDELSSMTTSFNPSLIGRTKNVRLACDLVGTRILNPGDVFSYNDAVGERTAARGFDYGSVYANGTVEDGIGGGICQVSSTIYAAALRADLSIVERKNHSYIVAYVNLGEDATVSWGNIDFRFENDTDFPIKVVTSHGKSTMTVKLVGTNLENKSVTLKTRTLSSTPFEVKTVLDTTLPIGTTKVKNNGFTGYVTETYRIVYKDGVEVSNTLENKSTYRKLDKVILENPAAPVVTDPITNPPIVTPPVTDPTSPTDPTNPPVTDPTTPTNPTGPTNPTDPVNPPDEPSNPGSGTQDPGGEPSSEPPGGGTPAYDGDPSVLPD